MKSEGAGKSTQGIIPAAVDSADEIAEVSSAEVHSSSVIPHMVVRTPVQSSASAGFFPHVKFHELPPDILGKILDLLTTDPNFCRALTRLAETGKEFNRIIVDFVNNYSASSARGVAKPAQVQVWKARAEFIKENVGKIAEDFEASQKIFSGMAATPPNPLSDTRAAKAAQFDGLTGIEFKLQDSALDPAEVAGLLSALEGKVIKLDARGIGRERFLNEVIPALRSVNPGCPIVLEASDNQLGSDDLKPLLDYMATSPRIYRLDLSGNPVCTGQGRAAELLQLFNFAGPLTHLNLSGTGFNDATAVELKETVANATGLTKLYLVRPE